MRTARSALLILPLIAVVACSGGDDAETSVPDSAATDITSPDTAGGADAATTAPPAAADGADRDDYVEATTASLADVTPSFLPDEAAARCVAAALVDAADVERLQEAGVSPDDFVGAPLRDSIPEAELDRARDTMANGLDGCSLGEPMTAVFTGEFPVVPSAEDTSCVARALDDSEQFRVGVASTFIDVDRTGLETAIVEALAVCPALVGNLVADIAAGGGVPVDDTVRACFTEQLDERGVEAMEMIVAGGDAGDALGAELLPICLPDFEGEPEEDAAGWADAEWVTHRGDPNDPSCQCADGSEHMFHSLDRDPDKVLLYYQGGGACFSAETCDFVDGTYKVTTGEDDHPDSETSGIFDWQQPGNPFADWTVVFVPYCSGDVFLGDNEYVYSPELTVQHRGALHAQKGLDHVVANYPEASELFVAGSSAGGVPTPRIGGMAADALPDTDITVLADASGGYASREGMNAGIGALWGTMNALPDWPELADPQPGTIGIPDLFTLTGQHAPRVELARFDNAYDEVQQSFSSLAGAGTTVLDVLDENEQMTEAAGVELDVYVAPGTAHAILLRPELWELEVEGVAFRDWLTTLVETGAPGDVRCTDCGRPAG